jgi:hypothetical protein
LAGASHPTSTLALHLADLMGGLMLCVCSLHVLVQLLVAHFEQRHCFSMMFFEESRGGTSDQQNNQPN